MVFNEALNLMITEGKLMKLPHWGGYWKWDEANQTIMMHCRPQDGNAGPVLDIRKTDRVLYTINNICSDEWEEATNDNCSLLGGTPMFKFEKAIEYMIKGIKVRRKGWSVDLTLDTSVTARDVTAQDWIFSE